MSSRITNKVQSFLLGHYEFRSFINTKVTSNLLFPPTAVKFEEINAQVSFVFFHWCSVKMLYLNNTYHLTIIIWRDPFCMISTVLVHFFSPRHYFRCGKTGRKSVVPQKLTLTLVFSAGEVIHHKNSHIVVFSRSSWFQRWAFQLQEGRHCSTIFCGCKVLGKRITPDILWCLWSQFVELNDQADFPFPFSIVLFLLARTPTLNNKQKM